MQTDPETSSKRKRVHTRRFSYSSTDEDDDSRLPRPPKIKRRILDSPECCESNVTGEYSVFVL